MTLYKSTAAGRIPMTADEEAEFIASLPQPQAPRVVTMRQARLALLAVGKYAAVQAAIDSMPSPQKEEAQIEWDYSSEVQRDRPLVQALAPALGLNDAALDALFTAAAAL